MRLGLIVNVLKKKKLSVIPTERYVASFDVSNKWQTTQKGETLPVSWLHLKSNYEEWRLLNWNCTYNLREADFKIFRQSRPAVLNHDGPSFNGDFNIRLRDVDAIQPLYQEAFIKQWFVLSLITDGKIEWWISKYQSIENLIVGHYLRLKHVRYMDLIRIPLYIVISNRPCGSSERLYNDFLRRC